MEDKSYVQDNVAISIIYTNEDDSEVTPEEVQSYIERYRDKKGEGEVPRASRLVALTLEVDKDEVDISYECSTEAFERIRRITGYLVGSLDRFNDAKRAEVEDRVKHSTAKKNKGMEIGD